MKITLIIALVIVVIATAAHDKWSYKKFRERAEINAKHPNWKPYCGINYLKTDPKWFIEHGYDEYI